LHLQVSQYFHGRGLKDRSPLGNSRSLSTPRLIDGRRRQAGLLARGWSPSRHLPGAGNRLLSSSGLDARRTTYSCGGSPGVTPGSHLNPTGGTCRAPREWAEADGSSRGVRRKP